MSLVDWPAWLADRLVGSVEITNLVPAESIFGSGGVAERPNPPFIVIRFGAEQPATVPGVSNQDSFVWIHDKPLNYLLIREVQSELRKLLDDSYDNTAGLIRVRWQGDSQDLTDPGYNTFTRTSSFRLIGRSM
jgi:hypothetical protein